MPTGRLGTADLAATTNTTVYTCPASTFAVVSVSVCNRSGSSLTIRLAVASTDSPTNAEWIEFGVQILANGVVERTGIVLSTGQRIVAWSSTTNVSVVVMGIETPTV